MKRLIPMGIAAAILIFLGYVMYSSMAPADVTCEVCLVFDGEEVCRMGSRPRCRSRGQGRAGKRLRGQRDGHDPRRAVPGAPAGADDMLAVAGPASALRGRAPFRHG